MYIYIRDLRGRLKMNQESMPMEERSNKMSILMLPWLAHGHISPFLELSKRLSDRNITIYFCSTSINLNPIKQRLAGTKYSSRILPVELRLPDDLPGLPPHLHTTKHLPPHLMPTLKTAFDFSEKDFSNILHHLRPDLVVYDFLQHWAPAVALSLGIPAVEFLCTSAAMSTSAISFVTNDPPRIDRFPFPEIHLRDYEQPGFVHLLEKTANGVKDGDRVKWCSEWSVGVILIKSFRYIEAKYIDYLSIQLRKKVVPVGPLVEEDHQHDHDNDGRRCEIIKWLDKKPEKSTVFVSFGSEYFLSAEEIVEIAHGLEQSKVNFIWVIRSHGGEHQGKIRAVDSLQDAIPEGFLERVGDRGHVTEGWAPQIEILRHPSTGGFLSHCGWSSVMEAMKFGVPIIAMPMHLDQPINARVVVGGVGVGLEVERDEEGRVRREEVARTVRTVVVERAGESVRRRARELRDLMVMRRESGEEDEEIDRVVDELLQICGKTNNNLVQSEEEEIINHRSLVPN